MHTGHRLPQDRGKDLWFLLKQRLTWRQIHHCKDTPQDGLVSTNVTNHRSLQAVLTERSMHLLEIHQLVRLTRWTQNPKNPWLLVNQLVSIQPGIEPPGQPRWFNLVGDTG